MTKGSSAPRDLMQDEFVGQILRTIRDHDLVLWEINKRIHGHPNIGYNEYKAHDGITELLDRPTYGEVTHNAYGLYNAFMAEFGSGGRVVAFNAEYDALSGVGSARGHNLTSVMSIASFISMAQALQASGKPGRVRLIGTPAEEDVGGKIKLIAAGAYKDVDACLMCHPGPSIAPEGIAGDAYMPILASHKLNVRFTGKNAHAAVAPWDGVNALDAVVLTYDGISIPRTEYTGLLLREASSTDALYTREKRCFDGAALQTGCEVGFKRTNTYADVRNNKTMTVLYVDAMASNDYNIKCDLEAKPISDSTDQDDSSASPRFGMYSTLTSKIGNVSYECPSVRFYHVIEAAPGSQNHMPGFDKYDGTRDAHDRCINSAKGMAVVGWAIPTEQATADLIRQEFEDDKRQRQLASQLQ